jgi:hypothetical protein
MARVIQAKIRGKTIELAENPGLDEGQNVVVAIRTVPADLTSKPGEGFLRTEGALADDPYWDEIMAEI